MKNIIIAFLFVFSPMLSAQDVLYVMEGFRGNAQFLTEVDRANGSLTNISLAKEGDIKPLDEYSNEEIELQKAINEQFAHEYVLTYSHEPDYVWSQFNNDELPLWEKNVDFEHITPYTWKWVHMEMEESEDGPAIIHLRRPDWWLNAQNANTIGEYAYINMPELNLSGLAKVTALSPSYIDTRVATFEAEGDYSYRPITGWFERYAPDTKDFVFSSGDTIGATPNHPFFSEDRDDYVPAGELKKGEQVRLANDKTATFVVAYGRGLSKEKVYDLEVWRDHNFFVGKSGFLVHNNCPPQNIKDLVIQKRTGTYIPANPRVPLDDLIDAIDGLGAKSDQFIDDMVAANVDNPGLFPTTQLTPGKVNAWEAAISTQNAIKQNIGDLEIIADYMNRTGKSVSEVKSEIPVSSVIEGKKWLGDRKIEPFLNTSPNIINLVDPPSGYHFVQQNDGTKYIRRNDKSDPYTPHLTVIDDVIVKFTQPQRISVSSTFKSNLESVYGPMPDNHQRHHIIPDNRVRNSELHKFAINNGWYDVDRASNGRYLAMSADDFVSGISDQLPTHNGPHGNYDSIIDDHIRDVLESRGINDPSSFDFNSLPNPESDVMSMIDEIEALGLDELFNWAPNVLR